MHPYWVQQKITLRFLRADSKSCLKTRMEISMERNGTQPDSEPQNGSNILLQTRWDFLW